MSKSRESLFAEVKALYDASSGLDAARARLGAFRELRERALNAGQPVVATMCLRRLAMCEPNLAERARLARQLTREHPRSGTYSCLAYVQRERGKLWASARAYRKALEYDDMTDWTRQWTIRALREVERIQCDPTAAVADLARLKEERRVYRCLEMWREASQRYQAGDPQAAVELMEAALRVAVRREPKWVPEVREALEKYQEFARARST